MENNQNIATNSYILVVEATLDGQTNMYQFDYVNDTSTTLSSEITTHPIINGDMIADHMYKEPISMTVSGTFSLHGNKRYNYGTSDRLANIQDIFERIKNEGVFCKLIKMNQLTGDRTRFKVRENMVLQTITWVEKQTSMDFTFTFTEALTVDINEVDYDVDVEDENLPSVTDATTLDFTDELLDMNAVTTEVVKTLQSLDLITNDFLEYVVKTSSAGLVIGAVAGVVVGIAIVKCIVTVCGSLAAIAPYGTIAAVAIAVATFVAIGFTAVLKGIEKYKNARKYKIEAFKLYKEDRKNEAECQRFYNYVGTIHQNLEHLNENMTVLSIPKNGNQELLTYIDNVYYIFSFIKNNISGKYDLRINTLDTTNSERFNKANISEFCCNSIDECKSETMLFKTDGIGSQVYLINKEIGNLIDKDASPEEIEKSSNDLTKYCILISKINMNEFNNTLHEIIVNAMTM